MDFGGLSWRVLKVAGDRVLLLSEYIIERRAYHHATAEVIWGESSLRQYLNGAFMQRFSDEEKACIIKVTNPNFENPWYYEQENANETEDHVFLLSLQEVSAYFSGNPKRELNPGEDRVSVSNKNNPRRIAYDTGGQASWWWLRTAGYKQTKAVYVCEDGHIDVEGPYVSSNIGVRPAMWVRIDTPGLGSDITANTAPGIPPASASATSTLAGKDAYEKLRFGGITWRVLDATEERALLLSERILEERHFHKVYNHFSHWESCTLRQYLNGAFLDRFSARDRARIQKVTNLNPPNPWYEQNAGNTSEDYVFLLSIDEAVWYFGDSGQIGRRGIEALDPSDPSHPGSIDDQYNRARIGKDKSGFPLDWWLRSPGTNQSNPAHVTRHGHIWMDGTSCTYPFGIRPALWLTLS